MKCTLLASVMSLLCANAYAASPSWDFVQGGYVQADIEDAGDFEPKGFELRGFKSFGENFFLMGSYSSLSEDEMGVDVELDQASVGIGYHYGVTANTDFFAALSYEYADVSVDAGFAEDDFDDNGYGVSAGVRSMVTKAVELRGVIHYVNVEEDDTAFELGADYFVTPKFAVGASYTIADDVDLFGISARYNF
ncbi:outer membrane beta-barrel protein [Paraglaciecola chathamensis]|uniref:Outer membrane beta-barrel protein n=1 Tax=Paraglaciecola chathamensis TaxID=368405 RepID=A0ABS0WJB8_9ALTE|nr:outer membrane beta-barrel protein [Paraglaciecola chathamensis]MBJ2138523.1 outer membrane beta-barrel protein [Paraglaciecola chathamensis]